MADSQRLPAAIIVGVLGILLLSAVVLAVVGAASRSVGLVADVISILAVTIGVYQWATRRLLATHKSPTGSEKAIERSVDPRILRLDPDLLIFLFLLFLGSVGAVLGGGLWAAINWWNDRAGFMGPSPYVGGELEPHGWAAVIWASTSLLPIALVAYLVLRRSSGDTTPPRGTRLRFGLFLVGAMIGAVIFYDIPIGRSQGFREYLGDERMLSFIEREFWLAMLWATVIAGTAFAVAGFTVGSDGTVAYHVSRRFAVQLALVVPITVLIVAAFLLAYPDDLKFTTGRGLVAGGALRVGVFFGLLLYGAPLKIRIGAIHA